ncbi:MAG: DUF2007 domain-containing protein [Verrucomicrobia bacterium]|nr:DUF2007 domain-containing protein [Verrucomicrobiota bacterium]
MEWVTLTKVFSPVEADMIRARLEAAGFPVNLRNMGAALSTEGYSMAIGGIWVQVPGANEAEARPLVTSLQQPDGAATE